MHTDTKLIKMLYEENKELKKQIKHLKDYSLSLREQIDNWYNEDEKREKFRDRLDLFVSSSVSSGVRADYAVAMAVDHAMELMIEIDERVKL